MKQKTGSRYLGFFLNLVSQKEITLAFYGMSLRLSFFTMSDFSNKISDMTV